VLIEPTVFAPPAPDLTGVHTVAGEFHRGELQARMTSSKLFGDIVEHWHRHAAGRRTVAFAVGVEHSRGIVEAFCASGVNAEHLDGSSPPEIRAGVLARLASGETQVVSNCDLFGEGFDLPALECAILARPTASLALHLQQIGRVMRSSDGKDDAVVLDHAGNTHRHGLVTDEFEYSLDQNVRKSIATNPRICKQCYAIMLTAVCSECGSSGQPLREGQPIGRGEVAVEQGELKEFKRAPFPDKRREYERLVRLASDKGWRLGWARAKYKQTFGVWPRLMKDVEALFVCERHEWQITNWGTRCARCFRGAVVKTFGRYEPPEGREARRPPLSLRDRNEEAGP
jgi:hypothetical protein